VTPMLAVLADDGRRMCSSGNLGDDRVVLES
jgi:hypothetical protein